MKYAKLKGKMRECGLTQADLSNILGISQNGVNKKLRGDAPFKVLEAIEIMNALDEPLSSIHDYFFE